MLSRGAVTHARQDAAPRRVSLYLPERLFRFAERRCTEASRLGHPPSSPITVWCRRTRQERTRLGDQLNELEIAERVLTRFGGKVDTTGGRRRGRSARTAPAAGG